MIKPQVLSAFVACFTAVGFSSLAQENPAKPAPPTPARGGAPDGRVPQLPEAITSFGAAVTGGQVYVYGGHIGKAHAHSRDNLADRFIRLDLNRPQQWETLPMQERLQGLALVGWKETVIRIGGVTARNASGEPTDMHSTADVARFDPKTNAWTALPSLPEPRSSFDAVVQGDKLYVIGGWRLAGSEKSGTWLDNNYVADLSEEPLRWTALPQVEFRKRALAVAATTKRVYALGGLTPSGDSTQAVRIFDPASGKWSDGPEFPSTGSTKGFGASAWAIGDTIWASASDGRVFSLDEGANAWRDTQHELAKPRFFHRILPHPKGSLLFIGGAGKGGHTETIENVDLSLLKAAPTSTLPSAAAPAPANGQGQRDWPGFRGRGDSHTAARDLPVEWSDTENIAWSAPLVGYGQSSPVIWNDRVFTTSVVGANKESLAVQCHRLTTGELLWTREIPNTTTQAITDYISKAAPTPAVDAERVYAFFETGDILAFDHDGKQVWQRSLTSEYGAFKGNHGVGSSPAQTSDNLILLIDHDGPSYLLALDKSTGANRWKTERPTRVSWSSPVVATVDQSPQIITSSSGAVEAYDAVAGARVWFASGFKMNNVPSPTIANGLIVAGSSDRDQTVAIRSGGHDDVTDSHVAWHAREASVNFASPLIVGQTVYSVNKAGVAFANNLNLGELRWSLRLPDSCWASPIAAGDVLYFMGKGGTTTVLREGPDGPQRVAENKLTVTGKLYGVAAVDRSLVLRSGERLVCIRSASIGQ